MIPKSKRTKIGGIVMCGGKSKRMGQPKAFLEFGNETLLQRVVRILQSIVDPIVVVAAKDQPLPDLSQDVCIERDAFAEVGPLAGIMVGLRSLEGAGVEAGYVTSCDAPFLQPQVIQSLIERLDSDTDIVLPKQDQFHHVLCAVYRTQVWPTAERLIRNERRRPLFLTEDHPTCVVEVDALREFDPDLVTFRNLNTREDYQRALLHWNEQEG